MCQVLLLISSSSRCSSSVVYERFGPAATAAASLPALTYSLKPTATQLKGAATTKCNNKTDDDNGTYIQ